MDILSIGKYLINGNLAAAEHICRTHLLAGVSNPDTVLLTLALIARRFGLIEHEEVYLKGLLRGVAVNARPPLPIDHIRIAFSNRNQPVDRYLVINSWHHGFWSDVSHLIGSYILAWLTNRIPVTNWRRDNLYSDDWKADAFIDYFKPISSVTLQDIPIEKMTIFPEYWTKDKLFNNDEINYPTSNFGPQISDIILSNSDVVVCDKYISPVSVLQWIIPEITPGVSAIAEQLASVLTAVTVPTDAIQQSVHEFIECHIGSDPFYAFHLRGTDKFVEQSEIANVNNDIIETISALPDDRKLFLMTDDIGWLSEMQARFGSRLIAAPASRNIGEIGVHHPSIPGPNNNGKDCRADLGREIMIDTFVAVDSLVFVGNGRSNVAAAIELYRRNLSRSSILVSPNQLLKYEDWGCIIW